MQAQVELDGKLMDMLQRGETVLIRLPKDVTVLHLRKKDFIRDLSDSIDRFFTELIAKVKNFKSQEK